MYLLLKPNQNSTWMCYAPITTERWNKLIAQPYVISDKAKAPLSIWGRMSPTVELDPVAKQPRCTAENVGKLFALQIDVDNGCSIDDFVKCYHRYSFQLYTSYSYGVFKPGYRFRVILPLAEPLETSWLVPPVKDNLIKIFDMVDVSCFDRAHWQILPCISSKDAPYIYMQHQGERLSFARENFEQMARDYQDNAHWKREIRKADYSTNSHAGALASAQKRLDEAFEGNRNRTMYSVIRWLKDTVGCDEDEVMGLNPPYGMDDEWTKMVLRIYK